MKTEYQLVVIGAGPAGMAAAQAAAQQGVEVALFDEQAQPGGQIYRQVDASPLDDVALLGKDYRLGKPLVQAFRGAHLDYFPSSSLWYLDKTLQLGILRDGVSHSVKAQKVILAGGAQERPMPIPGWQLPGVMGAGAAQILLKSAAMLPEDGVVLAGNGPLLLLLAWQYLQAGVVIKAILDTSPRGSRLKAMRHMPQALAASDYLWKGLRLMLSIKLAAVPWYKHASNLQAEGEACLQAVNFHSGGKQHRLETELLLLHQGVVPALHLAQAADCALQWNPQQQCWQAERDRWGQSSTPNVYLAGDGASIGGARAAHLDGKLVGLQVAHDCGLLEAAQRDRLAKPVFAARDRHLAIRPFLDACYPPAQDMLVPADDTMVCRCEEVSAGTVREVVEIGCRGPNQVKAFTRCGMGPCQGRFCASTVEQIIAHERGVGVEAVGRYSVRPPLKPVTLGQLAASSEAELEIEHD